MDEWITSHWLWITGDFTSAAATMIPLMAARDFAENSPVSSLKVKLIAAKNILVKVLNKMKIMADSSWA